MRDVKLEAARHLDLRLWRACGDQSRLIEIGLREDSRKRAQHVAEEPLRRPVPRRAPVAHPRVDEEKRNPHLLRLQDEVRPDLALGQNNRPRPHRPQRALHEVRKVQRIVDEDV